MTTRLLHRLLRPWYFTLPLLLVALLLLVGLAVLAVRWARDARLAEALEAIRAAGEPVTADDLHRWYAYPPGDNPADDFLKLFASIVEDEAFEEQFTRWMDFDAFRPLDDTIAPAIEAYLAKHQTALTLAEQVAPRGRARFELDFSKGKVPKLAFLGRMRRTVRLLGFRAQLAARDGRMDDANSDLVRMMQIAHATEGSPLTISNMVLVSNQLATLNTIQCIDRMGRARPQDYRLWQQLAQQAQEGTSQRLIDALVSERAVFIIQMQHMAQKSAKVRRTGIARRNIEAMLAVIEEQLALARGLPAPAKSRAESLLKDRRAALADMIAPGIIKHRDYSLETLAMLRVYEAAMAIRRYEADHGSPPPTLSALTPAYLAAMPMDPLINQPLLYRQDDSGWVVYSVGRNRVDDAGRPRSVDEDFEQKKSDLAYVTLEYERRHFPPKPRPAPLPPRAPSSPNGSTIEDIWGSYQGPAAQPAAPQPAGTGAATEPRKPR